MTGTFDALAELGLTAGRMSEAHYDHLTDSIASGALTEEDAVATVSELLRRTPAAEDAHGASPGADALYVRGALCTAERSTNHLRRALPRLGGIARAAHPPGARHLRRRHGLCPLFRGVGHAREMSWTFLGFDGLDTGCTVWDAARSTTSPAWLASPALARPRHNATRQSSSLRRQPTLRSTRVSLIWDSRRFLSTPTSKRTAR